MKFRIGELFCGPGGMALGAKMARVKKRGGKAFAIEHAWATDYDKDSCETYRKNMTPRNGKSVVCKDIRKLTMRRLKDISSIDALAFGFPCNDFSVVGKQRGINGSFGPLYEYTITALKHFRPKWFMAENVGGLRNSDDGKTLKTILEKLTGAGYNIRPHLYMFEKYGVPQARHRIIIVGVRKDLKIDFGIPSSAPYSDADVTCYKAITKPPIQADTPNHDFTRQSEAVVERLKYIKPGENAFTADIPKRLRLNVKGATISTIYKRLDRTKPAYTVTGSGGGGTHVYHWRENRALTNRERARLQTFPDSFVFSGSKESVRRQVGMAVPPEGARIVFEAILKSFAGIRYPQTEQNM